MIACTLSLTALLMSAPLPASVLATNTATSRSFTSEWLCENGRTLQFNAHPRRPREEAWVIYGGRRIEVLPQKSAAGEPARYASRDGKVIWVRLQDTSMLQMDELLPQPLTCTLKANSKPK